MNSLAKSIAVAGLRLPATLAHWLAGGVWRCFCLAWARAHLGSSAVPLDNQILGLLDIEGTKRIRLGHGCRIYKHVRLETREEGEIVIGNHVVLSPGTVVVAHERVTIDDYVMVGEYCSIRDQDHRTDAPPPLREAGYLSSPVDIGRDAWIGRGTAILKGVTIGDGAIVGCNSVVTRDIPAAEIWVGTPARFLRPRTTDDPSTARLTRITTE